MSQWAYILLAKTSDTLTDSEISILGRDFIFATFEECESMLRATTVKEQLKLWDFIERLKAEKSVRQKAFVRWILCGGIIYAQLKAWNEFIKWWDIKDCIFSSIKIPEGSDDKKRIYTLICHYFEDQAILERIKPPATPDLSEPTGNWGISANEPATTDDNVRSIDEESIIRQVLALSKGLKTAEQSVCRLPCLKGLPERVQIELIDSIIGAFSFPEAKARWQDWLQVSIVKKPTLDDIVDTENAVLAMFDLRSAEGKTEISAIDLFPLIPYLQIPIETLEILFSKHKLSKKLLITLDRFDELEDREIQIFLREISSDVLIDALLISPEAVKVKVFSNMSKRAAELLGDDMAAKTPSLERCEKAAREVEEVFRTLVWAGDIGD